MWVKWLHLMQKNSSSWVWQGTCSAAWATVSADHLVLAGEVYGSCRNLGVSIAMQVSLQWEKREEFSAIWHVVTFSDLSDTKPASLSLEAETPQPSSSYAPANLPVTSAGKDRSLLTTVAIESKQPLGGGLHSTCMPFSNGAEWRPMQLLVQN